MDAVINLNILITKFNISDDETDKESLLEEMGRLIVENFDIGEDYYFADDPSEDRTKGELVGVNVCADEGVTYLAEIEGEEDIIEFDFAFLGDK